VNRHVTLRLPSLPLHLALLASRSLALPAALARALLLHIPSLLLGTSRPLKSREPKRRERERELVSPRKGSSPLLPNLALNPPSSSHIRLCPVALRFSDPRFGRPRLRERDKDWIFPAMEAWPDPFRPGRWSGFLTRSDSYWFK
jgi:hypothetical protein